MTLGLNGIEVSCIIGERPDERVRVQKLRVDVSLVVPDAAASSDELADTVDYAALTQHIREGLVAARCKMIERAAKIVADVCMSDARVREATVRVTKAGAISYLESASATCSVRRRDGELENGSGFTEV